MYYETDECCGCDAAGYECIGTGCALRRVKHYICDECGKEVDGKIYMRYGYEYCAECAREKGFWLS